MEYLFCQAQGLKKKQKTKEEEKNQKETKNKSEAIRPGFFKCAMHNFDRMHGHYA